MRKSIVLVVVTALLLVVAPVALGASSIGVNPLAISADGMWVEFETAVGRATTLGLYGMSSTPGLGNDFSDVTASGFGVGLRFYANGKAHDGLYIGLYGSTTSIKGEYKGDKAEARVLAASAVAGYKWLIGSSLFVDFGANATYPVGTTIKAGDAKAGDYRDAFGTGFTLGVGLVF